MNIKFYAPLLAATIVAACTTKSKHPQSELANQSAASAETDQSINFYADSLDKQVSNLEKQQSMAYHLAEQSLYIEKFNWNGKAVMYIQYLKNEGISEKTTKYYLKNDSVLLIKESLKRHQGQGELFEDRQIYIRNHTPFKTTQRSADSFGALQAKNFADLKAPVSPVDFQTELSNLNDALKGVNKFDMVFDQFISTAEGDFLLLKSKIPGGYGSSIRVNERDQLIDSIQNEPAFFKDAKLNISWKVADHEAVYVPVASSITSAKGLKR